MKYILVWLSFLFLGNVHAQYALPELTFTPLGSSTNNLRVGRTVELGKFRMSNPGRKNVILESLRFKNYGRSSLDRSLENAVLVDTLSEVVASGYGEGRFISFDFGNGGYVLERGSSMTFRIQATLAYARTGDRIELGIQRQEDLRATEYSSGFGVPSNAEGIRLKSHTLKSGDIHFSSSYRSSRQNTQYSPRYRSYRGSYRRRLSSNYSRSRYQSSSSRNTYRRSSQWRSSSQRSLPQYTRTKSVSRLRTTDQGSYNPGSRDVLFFNQYVSSNRNIAIDGVYFEVLGNVSGRLEDSFEDMRLFIDGHLEASSGRFDVVNGRTVLLFDQSMDIVAGNHQWQVTGRVSRNAQNADRIRLRLDKSGFLDVEYY